MSSVLFDTPGPRARRRITVINVVGALVVLAVLGWVVWGLAAQDQFTSEKWLPLVQPSIWVNYLIVGLTNTLRAAAISIVTSLAFGMLFGLGRLSHVGPVRWVCGVVVEFFRAVPVLIMMIFFYTFIAQSGLVPASEAPFLGVVIGLTLYNGSVIAELVRSGVHNLPAGQREAAMAVGLTPGRSRRIIEMPQALIAMMPSLVSQLVVILKDTALGAIVTYPELLRSAERAASNWSNFIPAMIVTAAIFILINYSLTRVARFVHRRLDRRTATTPKAGAGEPAEERAAPASA